MKKRVVIVAVAAVALLLAGVYLWGPSAVPAGQEPLTVLSSKSLSKFAAAFDADSAVPRMLLLLSPT